MASITRRAAGREGGTVGVLSHCTFLGAFDNSPGQTFRELEKTLLLLSAGEEENNKISQKNGRTAGSALL